jgi:hypothetical protein
MRIPLFAFVLSLSAVGMLVTYGLFSWAAAVVDISTQ